MPERDHIRKLFLRLEAQPTVPFPQARERLVAPEEHGVYVIRTTRRRVVHVGRTLRGKKGLRQRLRNHLAAESSFVNAYLAGKGERLRSGYTYQCLVVRDDRRRALLEHYATAWHCPAHLGVGASLRPKSVGRATKSK
jgi:hypothetical protein